MRKRIRRHPGQSEFDAELDLTHWNDVSAESLAMYDRIIKALSRQWGNEPGSGIYENAMMYDLYQLVSKRPSLSDQEVRSIVKLVDETYWCLEHVLGGGKLEDVYQDLRKALKELEQYPWIVEDLENLDTVFSYNPRQRPEYFKI